MGHLNTLFENEDGASTCTPVSFHPTDPQTGKHVTVELGGQG